uniref:Uncharacterized protein n=1 Tax=Podoviridae sp. ctlpi2 TaxID=2826574 RepID=A0A8S5MLB3_9CAUD|nr:MAG TPA: hypothetical protein [Podoviridae sp. ctlpi2]
MTSPKYRRSWLNRQLKSSLYALLLKEHGEDTAGTYRHYTKAEMVDDLAVIIK